MSQPTDRASPSTAHVRSNGHTIHPNQTQPLPSIRRPTPASTSLQPQYYNPVPPSYMPGGSRSLSGISIHAFSLGIALGLCTSTTILLLYTRFNSDAESPLISRPEGNGISYLWRIPFFIATLSVFHYLEFDMTARYNTIDARISSFLLFSNGWAYNVAHCAAMIECVIRWRFGGAIASFFSGLGVPGLHGVRGVLHVEGYDAVNWANSSVGIGLVLIVLGQTMRSLAMKTAGKSFNHIVQATKKNDHVLVSHGVYGWCRHPSYFGFFWWGLGTQFVLGNWFCLLAYGAILWSFFSHRIAHEEKHLVQFFGQAYSDYRKKTPVLIPFIS